MLNRSALRQLYVSEFQTEGALTLNAFADIVSAIRGTTSNSLYKGREGTGPLCGKGVKRGGEEKRYKNGDVSHLRPSSYSLLCVRESNQMKCKHMTLIHYI